MQNEILVQQDQDILDLSEQLEELLYAGLAQVEEQEDLEEINMLENSIDKYNSMSKVR